MVPEQRRGQIAQAMQDTGTALRLWLKAQIVAMVVIGAVTGLGLWMLGVPYAFALGILAGLLEFVPHAGPVIAAIPGVLMGLVVSPTVGLYTLAFCVVVQQLESYVLQPLLQQWAVKIPGFIMLFAILAAGTIFGPIGLIFAAPLTVVIYVLVKRLYVQDVLDTDTPMPGDD